MTQQDIDRVQDAILEQEAITESYKNIIDVRRKQLSIERSQTAIAQSIETIKTRGKENKEEWTRNDTHI